MAVVGEIFLERETANDEDGVVVAIHVDSGQAVKSGQPLFDVEHSKATMEVCASVDGFVLHELTKGTSVTFGSRIAYVVDAIDAHRSAPPLPAGASQQAKAPLEAALSSAGDKISVGSATASTPPAGGGQPK
ncbi:MAG: biotin/lipoyl-containing protein [Roseiarcus sp.]